MIITRDLMTGIRRVGSTELRWHVDVWENDIKGPEEHEKEVRTIESH